MSEFVNREHELNRLQDLYASETPRLAVVYGRRRMGKTTLVLESIRDRDDAVYYQATRGTPEQQRAAFINEVTPVDSETSLEAATIESPLADAGTSLDTGDLLVAATARQHDGTLATANKNDFDKAPIHQLMDVDIVPTS